MGGSGARTAAAMPLPAEITEEGATSPMRALENSGTCDVRGSCFPQFSNGVWQPLEGPRACRQKGMRKRRLASGARNKKGDKGEVKGEGQNTKRYSDCYDWQDRKAREMMNRNM